MTVMTVASIRQAIKDRLYIKRPLKTVAKRIGTRVKRLQGRGR